MPLNLYSVLLPTYNERENLPIMISLLDSVFSSNRLKYEVVVIDDSSPDGTYEVAEELQSLFGREHLVLEKRPGKLGLGSAYVAGLKRARGNFVFLMDADLSHHPKYIPQFIARQREGDFDIVTGSRYVPDGGVCNWDLQRKLTSRVANFLADLLLNPQVSDLTGSFRLFKREALDRIMLSMESKGYVFQMEVVIRARSLAFSIGEVPIVFVDRLFGQSKLGAGEIVQYLRGLFHLFLVQP